MEICHYCLILLAHFNAEFPHGAKHSQSVVNFKLFNPKLPFYLISCGLMNTSDPNTLVDICLHSLLFYRSRGIFFSPFPFTLSLLPNSSTRLVKSSMNTPATTRCGFKDLDSLPGKETKVMTKKISKNPLKLEASRSKLSINNITDLQQKEFT